jgi:hypothetical protein
MRQVRRLGACRVVLGFSSLAATELNGIGQALETTGLPEHIHSGMRGIDVRRTTISPLATRRSCMSRRSGSPDVSWGPHGAMDVLGGLAALLLLSPLVLLSGLLVWTKGRGPLCFARAPLEGP